MSTLVHLVVPGPPPRKNRIHGLVVRNGKPSRYNTKDFRAFVEAVSDAAVRERAPLLSAGTWSLHLTTYWPQLRHLDVDVPRGDADASVSCVMDALQRANVLDDDARITEISATKRYSASNPRTEIILRRIHP